MNRLKILTAAVTALLLVIIVFQNTEPVDTRVLFVTVSMPRAALLFFTALLGFAIGLLTAWSISRPKGG